MDQAAPVPVLTRPTPLAERTLAGALGALWMLAVVLASMLLGAHWPDAVAGDRVRYLGIGLILALIGILVLIIGFASPWLGSVRMTGMGATIDINGEQGNG